MKNYFKEQTAVMRLRPYAGVNIYRCVEEAIELAKSYNTAISFIFNGRYIEVTKDTKGSNIFLNYDHGRIFIDNRWEE